MKNKFKNLFLMFVLSVTLCLTTFLSACGATPSSKVTGIKFDTMKYDPETGYAVFEVDKDVTTDLKCKVFPSTSAGYRVYFDPVDKGTAINSSRFTFEDGKITINSEDFEDVKYKVKVSDYSDMCIIRLKEYPTAISTTKTSVDVNTGETVAINVEANFLKRGVSSHKNITENDYDFLVESSDETIVDIPNEHRLKFCAVRNGNASAKVTVTILDKQGQKTNLFFEITVNITQNAGDAFVLVSGANKLAYDESEIDIDYTTLSTETGYRVVNFDIMVVDSSNKIIEEDCEYTIELSSQKFAKLSSDGKYVLINDSVEDDYVLKLKIITNMTMKDGSLFAVDLQLRINK